MTKDMISSQRIPEDERISCIHLIRQICPPKEECAGWFTLPFDCRQEFILCNFAVIGFRFQIDDATDIYVYGKTGYYGERSGDVDVVMRRLGGNQGYTIGKVNSVTRHRCNPTIAGINLRGA
ncbi:MAG: hypothetical protein M0Q91_05435 [Methanoregula sp.]|jgi:hypothetical protein|nr:hypothetical protein [Methanoregula sp.]